MVHCTGPLSIKMNALLTFQTSGNTDQTTRRHTPVTMSHLPQMGFSTFRATVSYTTVPRASYFHVPYLLYNFCLLRPKCLQLTVVPRSNFIRLALRGNAPSALNGRWPDAAVIKTRVGRGINCKSDLTLQ
jgi:hypothetical protein